MIIQCNPPIEVITPLGKGWCLFLIDYGISVNTIWIVRLDNKGSVRHFESNDIFVVANLMLKQ